MMTITIKPVGELVDGHFEAEVTLNGKSAYLRTHGSARAAIVEIARWLHGHITTAVEELYRSAVR
jgi:hypothetical protein